MLFKTNIENHNQYMLIIKQVFQNHNVRLKFLKLYNRTFKSIKSQPYFSMQTLKLKLIHAFGSTSSKSYRNSVAICDQNKNQPKIVFPSGKTLARKYVDRSQMDFIQFSQTAQQIECITVLPTKTHCAVVQKPFGSNLHIIKIYPMQGKQEPHLIKIFSEADKIGRIKQIVFSKSQPKFMCAHLGQPHNKLLYIDTSRNKPLAESNFPLKQIQKLSICPQNSHLICISGGSTLKLYKVEQYAFKPLQDIRKMPKNRIITEHCWFGERKILAATDKAEILFIEEIKTNLYQVRQEYRNVFNNNQPQNNIEGEKFAITCICPFSRGFIMGSGNGKFCLWTKKQDYININGEQAQKFQLTRKWSTTAQRQCAVRSISINSKQDLLMISMSNNDIAVLYLQEIIPQISDLIKEDSTLKEKEKQKEINFQYLYKGFHSAPITGIDICQQRPLFATISREDSTIRVWNYKSFGCKLLRMFYFKIKGENDEDKPLITLTFHPSGYYMAVGCVDKLRIFHVMNNQLRPFKQVSIRKCHQVKFSHGGHLLAVAHEFNPQLQYDYIRVYNALTLQQVYTFKDCQSIVKQIKWKNWDEMLCGVYRNGTLIEWKVSDWSVNKKILRPEITFGSCVYNHSAGSTLVFEMNNSTKSNLIEQYGQNNQNRNIQIDMKVTKMLEIEVRRDKSYFLLGLENGNLVSFLGFDSLAISGHQNHHVSSITGIVLSPCGNFVITCGEDGLIFVYSVKILTGQITQKQQYSYSTVVDDFLADVVLVNKKQVQKYTDKQKQYSKIIGSLSKKLKILTEESQKRHIKNIQELQNQKNRTIDDIEYRKKKLTEQIQLLQKKNAQSLAQLDSKGLSHIQSLQLNYQEKLAFEAEKYFQLQQQFIQLKVLHQKKLESMHIEEQSLIKQLKNQFENKFKQSQNVFSQTKKQNTQATNIFDLRLKQIEEEQEQQIRQLQNKRQQFKKETTTVLEEYHQKLQKFKKQFSTLQKQKNQVKTQNDQLSFQKKKSQKEVNQAKQKLKDLEIDFEQKLQSLKNKQNKIMQFQQKINELQKKKHILAYKATQMKKAIEPKEYQIERLKNDLLKLKKQFESSLERKEKSNLYLQKINKQKQYLQKTLQQQKKHTQQEVNLLQQLLMDIYVCLQKHSRLNSSQNNRADMKNSSVTTNDNKDTDLLPDHKIYFKQLIKLYHKYVDNNGTNVNATTVTSKSGSTKPSDQQKGKNFDQVNKQVVHLQKSLFQLNKSNQKNILRKNQEIFKRSKQNTELINNLNQLKKQNRQFILKIKSKNVEIDSLKASKQDLLNVYPQKTNLALLKLMNVNNDEGFGMETYCSLKKVVANPTAVSNITSLSSPSNNALLPGVKNKSIRNLHSVSNKEQTPLKLQTYTKPSSQIVQKTTQSVNIKKKQCEIVSEIEFISQKVHKYDFYINDMMEKVKKHANYANCQRAKDFLEDFRAQ